MIKNQQNRGFIFNKTMKIRRISGFQNSINFNSVDQQFNLYYERFKKSDLGKVHSAIPWDSLVKQFGLKN